MITIHPYFFSFFPFSFLLIITHLSIFHSLILIILSVFLHYYAKDLGGDIGLWAETSVLTFVSLMQLRLYLGRQTRVTLDRK